MPVVETSPSFVIKKAFFVTRVVFNAPAVKWTSAVAATVVTSAKDLHLHMLANILEITPVAILLNARMDRLLINLVQKKIYLVEMLMQRLCYYPIPFLELRCLKKVKLNPCM